MEFHEKMRSIISPTGEYLHNIDNILYVPTDVVIDGKMFNNNIRDDKPHYDSAWVEKIPQIIMKILIENPNVVLAGGAVVSLLNSQNVNDWDLFVIGEKSWHTVFNIASLFEPKQVSIIRGLVNIKTVNICIQIILRAIPSIHALLHGFDLPHCGLAFNGRRLFATNLAKYCFQKHEIIVTIKYCSVTFCERIRKYLSRGFNLRIADGDICFNTYLQLGSLKIKLRGNDMLYEYFDCGELCTGGYFDKYLEYIIRRKRYDSRASFTTYNNCAGSAYWKQHDPAVKIMLNHDLSISRGLIIGTDYDNMTFAEYVNELGKLPDFDIVYKKIIQNIFRIKTNEYKPTTFIGITKILKHMFTYDELIGIQNKSITFRAAVKRVYDKICNISDKKIELWIIDNPTSQFDMRRAPVDISKEEFYLPRQSGEKCPI